ncbi:MAG: hypothetical protein KZQ75_10180 [Candidatus Thiodiazotropha sp. (ex Myrtea spinifera)]|nr:hypothetical protein [Candidatus Thiodiazotropha sp. (ex Myrtea spinifera)]MCU7828128.1 hypothetical protein [Candidatus Thiodiazotropha sp. (ex Myrtea sp. 'scaly one' KF741663)]
MKYLWKTYFFVLLAIFILGFQDYEVTSENITYDLFIIFGFIGFAGFVFQIAIGKPVIWKLYFGIILIAAGAFLSFIGYSVISGRFESGMFDILLILVIQIPYWYGLWKYAYKSQKLWSESA